MGKIPSNALHTQLWNKVFGLVNQITNPGSSSKWVYSSFPERPIEQEADYPIIVIEPVKPSFEPLTIKDSKAGTVGVDIEIYSTSANQIDSLSDSVIDKIITNNAVFTVSGIYAMRLVSSDYDNFTRNSTRVHMKRVSFEFDYEWMQ